MLGLLHLVDHCWRGLFLGSDSLILRMMQPPKSLSIKRSFTFSGISPISCIPCFTLKLSLERLKDPEQAFSNLYESGYSSKELGCLHPESSDGHLWICMNRS